MSQHPQRRHARTGSQESASIPTAGLRDAHQQVTDAIVRAIESGTPPWRPSWNTGQGAFCLPTRFSGEAYRGINILLLWGAQLERGYQSGTWMTYRQSQELGAQVRKGEKGSTVIYYGQVERAGEGETTGDDRVLRFLRSYMVFNTEQIDGLPQALQAAPVEQGPLFERIAAVEQLIERSRAEIRYGGNRAYYRPSTDSIQMPVAESFRDVEFFYATLLHELVHWTKAPQRLDRRFDTAGEGDSAYAREELVAELGAAFLGAHFGFPVAHLEDHASYVANWLKALRDDRKLIFALAAQAQSAVDYLLAAATPPAGSG